MSMLLRMTCSPFGARGEFVHQMQNKKKQPRAVLEVEHFLNEQSDDEIAKATTYKQFHGTIH